MPGEQGLPERAQEDREWSKQSDELTLAVYQGSAKDLNNG